MGKQNTGMKNVNRINKKDKKQKDKQIVSRASKKNTFSRQIIDDVEDFD